MILEKEWKWIWFVGIFGSSLCGLFYFVSGL